MVVQICVDIDSGNDLLPDGTNLSPEPILTSHWWGSMTFSQVISQVALKLLFRTMSFKTILLKWLPHTPHPKGQMSFEKASWNGARKMLNHIVTHKNVKRS